MAHHWLPHLRGDWVFQLTNAFLIRHPAEMLPSLAKKMGPPILRDTGLPQQVEIFREVQTRTGVTPPVLDTEDVLRDPRGVLQRFCAQVGVAFDERMLHWPAGRRETDGVWAKYWYDALLKSTTFQPYKPKNEPVPPHLQDLLHEAERIYAQLYDQRIQ